MTMTKLGQLLAGMMVAGGLAACGGGDKDIEAFVKLDTDKAAAFSVGGDDCEAKATSVREWRTKNNKAYKAMQDKLKEKFKGGPPEDVKKKYGEQLEKNKKAVIDAMMNCSSNDTFGKAIDET
jgi:hypothetical protein